MTCKPTLRAHTQSLQRFLSSLIVTLRYEISSLIHPLLHRLQVFHFREFASNNTEYDVLVRRQAFQWFEASCSRGIVLEVVCIHVHFLKQLLCNAIVATFGEVTAVDKVAATEMYADMHICGAFGEAVIVKVDVLVEGLVGCLGVRRVFLPAFEHLFGAKVCVLSQL